MWQFGLFLFTCVGAVSPKQVYPASTTGLHKSEDSYFNYVHGQPSFYKTYSNFLPTYKSVPLNSVNTNQFTIERPKVYGAYRNPLAHVGYIPFKVRADAGALAIPASHSASNLIVYSATPLEQKANAFRMHTKPKDLDLNALIPEKKHSFKSNVDSHNKIHKSMGFNPKFNQIHSFRASPLEVRKSEALPESASVEYNDVDESVSKSQEEDYEDYSDSEESVEIRRRRSISPLTTDARSTYLIYKVLNSGESTDDRQRMHYAQLAYGRNPESQPLLRSAIPLDQDTPSENFNTEMYQDHSQYKIPLDYSYESEEYLGQSQDYAHRSLGGSANFENMLHDREDKFGRVQRSYFENESDETYSVESIERIHPVQYLVDPVQDFVDPVQDFVDPGQDFVDPGRDGFVNPVQDSLNADQTNPSFKSNSEYGVPLPIFKENTEYEADANSGINLRQNTQYSPEPAASASFKNVPFENSPQNKYTIVYEPASLEDDTYFVDEPNVAHNAGHQSNPTFKSNSDYGVPPPTFDSNSDYGVPLPNYGSNSEFDVKPVDAFHQPTNADQSYNNFEIEANSGIHPRREEKYSPEPSAPASFKNVPLENSPQSKYTIVYEQESLEDDTYFPDNWNVNPNSEYQSNLDFRSNSDYGVPLPALKSNSEYEVKPVDTVQRTDKGDQYNSIPSIDVRFE